MTEKGMMKLSGEEKTFSEEEISAIRELGWDFRPYAPNDWRWFKYDADGNKISKEGSITWRDDLIKIGALIR